MLESLKDSLEPNSEESTQFLEIVSEIFIMAFGPGKVEARAVPDPELLVSPPDGWQLHQGSGSGGVYMYKGVSC